MTPEEYGQLKAFARIDGAILGAVWIASFFLCIAGFSNPGLSLAGSFLAIASPLMAGKRLMKFRDSARQGIISFRRAAAYYVLMFFYASLLMAVAQYVYLAYIDNGYVLSCYTDTLSLPETRRMLEGAGLSTGDIDGVLEQMGQTPPIMAALNIMTFNISVGIMLSPIAALAARRTERQNNNQKNR